MQRNRPALGPGQEAVWDYPRPPRIEESTKHIQVVFNGVVIADTRRAKRVLETSHPPVYYIPRADIKEEYLQPVAGASVCEWKGRASYLAVVVGDQHVDKAAWSYVDPLPAFATIAGYVAFYPAAMDGCYVDGERVQPQAGGFYGGWITGDIVGPFKGEAGTGGW